MDKGQAVFLFDKQVEQATVQKLLVNLFNHHLLIVGQTGSGKTTTALSLLNRLQQLNQTTIVLDPTGEYAQLPNAITYRLGDNAYLEAGTLSASELQEVLGLRLSPLLQEKLEQAITALRVQHNLVERPGVYQKCGRTIDEYQQLLSQLGAWATDYQPRQLFWQLIEEFTTPYDDQRANYHLLGQQYDRTAINQNWSKLTTIRERLASSMFTAVFDTMAHPGTFKTELSFILKLFLSQRSMHRTLVLDLSLLKHYENSQRALISFLLKKILNLRQHQLTKLPVNIVIDEAHRYLPTNESDLADNGIFQVLREGRKWQLKMMLTTQSPLDLPAQLRSQFSNIIIHRLTDSEEMKAIGIRQLEASRRLAVGSAYLKVADQVCRVRVNQPTWWKK